ncbi:MAG: hypothetical protein F6K39_02365 [Okeania sp. SIO3B3]|nr:hypothetical protein [Okeania sp. SIO3B3]
MSFHLLVISYQWLTQIMARMSGLSKSPVGWVERPKPNNNLSPLPSNPKF